MCTNYVSRYFIQLYQDEEIKYAIFDHDDTSWKVGGESAQWPIYSGPLARC